MSFDPYIADIRFGLGLSERSAPPLSADDMLNTLAGPDRAAQQFPIPPFSEYRAETLAYTNAQRAVRQAETDTERQERIQTIDAVRESIRGNRVKWMQMRFARCVATHDPFRERLTLFWGDHFTVVMRQARLRAATNPYVEEAIRPHVGGTFRDMLISAVLHPAMLIYLDQFRSIGPNSRRANRESRQIGLNENLAREILELHTLGVGGPYTQEDVRQLAELLTGVTVSRDLEMVFNRSLAEPGAETILGRVYQSDIPEIGPVIDALTALAEHPATARHVATKLARHFVSDTPGPALIDDLAQTFLDTNGHLPDMYHRLLTHPDATRPALVNMKQHLVYIASASRGLGIDGKQVADLPAREARQIFMNPMAHMGQTWLIPSGPDGWPEEDSNWAAPQALAERMNWAFKMPQRLLPKAPDPRVFVDHVLGPFASDEARFAARAAETRWDGIGLVLISPEFQRQ